MTPCPICGGSGKHYPPCSDVGDQQRPDGYPLPWCVELDMPYWRINLILCLCRDGWREWQSDMSMQQVIPEIDRLIAATTPTGDQS